MLKKASEYQQQSKEFLIEDIKKLEIILDRVIERCIGEDRSYCNHAFYEANHYIWAGNLDWLKWDEKIKGTVCVYYYDFESKSWIPTTAFVNVVEKLASLGYGVSFSTAGITIKINLDKDN